MGQIERIGWLKLSGIATGIYCGFPLIVISSIFTYHRLYETPAM